MASNPSTNDLLATLKAMAVVAALAMIGVFVVARDAGKPKTSEKTKARLTVIETHLGIEEPQK